MHGLFKWSSKWWPGVIPLVVMWGIAAWTSTATVEADLAAAAVDRLRAAEGEARISRRQQHAGQAARARPPVHHRWPGVTTRSRRR